jgi:D-lactate dehydrogenase
MKILFYSVKDFEIPYLNNANKGAHKIVFESSALSPSTVAKAEGFDAVCIFINDDASATVIEALQKLDVKYIAVRAAGHDNVDLEITTELGIKVANTPSYSPYAIAEHAVALMLSLNRRITTANKQVLHHDFTTTHLIGFDLHGKTVGIIGIGKIGSILIKIMNGFGCKVLGYDVQEKASLTGGNGFEYVDLNTLCRQSDVISMHTSLNEGSKYIIGKKQIDLMKPGVMLINTSRGACVNTADVIAGLESGQIGYYGADVYEKEREIFFNDLTNKDFEDAQLKKLLQMPNVLITPHQAFATKEALTNIATATFDNINCWENKIPSKNELLLKPPIVTVYNNDEGLKNTIYDWEIN